MAQRLGKIARLREARETERDAARAVVLAALGKLDEADAFVAQAEARVADALRESRAKLGAPTSAHRVEHLADLRQAAAAALAWAGKERAARSEALEAARVALADAEREVRRAEALEERERSSLERRIGKAEQRISDESNGRGRLSLHEEAA